MLDLLDGAVDLSNAAGTIALASGEQGIVEAGQPPRKTPFLKTASLLQWYLYYPGVLAIEELELTAAELGWGELQWEGSGIHETGRRSTGEVVVRIDPRYFRPTEVESLLGDARKARRKLGWKPRTSFKSLVAEMVREDLRAAECDELVKRHGYSAYDYNE